MYQQIIPLDHFYIYYMKNLSIVLLAIIALASAAEVLTFGESAVNAIFKQKKDAVILFTSSNDAAEVNDAFSSAASRDETGRVYTAVDRDANSDHFTRFAEYLGVSVDSTPVLVVLIDAKNKFIAAPEDISDEGIEAFVTRVQNGEVTKLLKSAPIPENDNEAVKTLVGKNYRDVVFGDDKEFLVKFYAPWCGHCKTIAPEFVAAAEAIASNPNIVLAELDGTLNEVEGVDISGFPTIFWYPKDKTQEPIQYNGGRDKEGIISWLKDHTQHPWVEESEAEPEETVEAEL